MCIRDRTSEVQGVVFSMNGYHFNGSKVDRRFSYSKIDEIRNGFSEWLEEQSPQFKERLVTMYNRKFNCFVRPRYDGSRCV